MERNVKTRRKTSVYNEEEKKKFYELWKTSVMKIGQFCDHYDLTKSVFYGWRQHFNEVIDAQADALFSPAQESRSVSIATDSMNVKLVLPNHLELHLSLREKQLIHFLQENRSG